MARCQHDVLVGSNFSIVTFSRLSAEKNPWVDLRVFFNPRLKNLEYDGSVGRDISLGEIVIKTDSSVFYSYIL